MFRIRKADDELTVEMHSDVGLIASIIEPCMEFLKQYHPCPSPDIILVLRELMRNAVTHGNGNDLKKRVFVSLRHLDMPGVSGRGSLDVNFAITVTDEGMGFDHAALDLRLPEVLGRVNRRGLILVNAVVDKLEFNETGNSVVAYVHLVDVPETAVG